MQVKLKGARWGDRDGTTAEKADYEGRRLIEEGQAEAAVDAPAMPASEPKKARPMRPARRKAKQE